MKKLSTEKLDLIKSTLSEEELGLALEILEEINESGSSELLDELWSEDYEELPVDIKTFITDPDYLGQAFMAKDGSCLIYDYWLDTLEKVFSPDSSTIELALSGAIGLGKSTIADIGLAYILHKLLCLKDPAAYYRLTKGSRIAIALFNITLDQGYGVGYTKLQNMLKQSPWFLRHGSIVGNKYPTYVPGKDIDIIVGSKSEHFIGRDVFCVTGDTQVLTDVGFQRIDKLSELGVANIITENDDGTTSIVNDVEVRSTKVVDSIIEIVLEDDSVIKCSSNHPIRLIDGTYKPAGDLLITDEIREIEPFGYIYKVTNTINGKIYIGQHQGTFVDTYKGSGTYIRRAIRKYGWDNFKVEPIEFIYTNIDDLNTAEIHYINLYNSMDKSIGYNLNGGGKGMLHYYPSESTIQKLRLAQLGNQNFKGKHHTEEHKNYMSNLMKNREFSSNTRARMSKSAKGRSMKKATEASALARRGKPLSESTKKKLSESMKGRIVSQVTRDKLRQAKLGTHFNLSEEAKQKISESNRRRKGNYSEETKDKLRKSRTKYIYLINESVKTYGWVMARNYLRDNGYPSISQTTIEKLSNGKKVRGYSDLVIRRILNED